MFLVTSISSFPQTAIVLKPKYKHTLIFWADLVQELLYKSLLYCCCNKKKAKEREREKTKKKKQKKEREKKKEKKKKKERKREEK